ncbi:MAG: BatA and WFA domain-containing protein [Verrucomicrobiales bacterium]|nr:BatA and WFA domain-containing protein [Verrucomicrobiales bacterium]
MPLIFSNAVFLSALAGLAIPVVIHLLLKRKTERVRFSTIRFFVAQDLQASSRRKLRNLLLLTLRLLILALLVLAFARPFLPTGSASPGARRPKQMVLVLDESLSLQAVDDGAPRWTRAVQAAKEALKRLQPGDRAALVSCEGKARVVSGLAPAEAVLGQLETRKPSWGAADLAEGLREAVRVLAAGDPRASSSVVVVSDFQRSGAGALAAVPVPDSIDIQLRPVGDLASPNLAVSELSQANDAGAPTGAVVLHHGDREIPGLKTEFRVDGKLRSETPVSLKPGSSTHVALSLSGLRPGWHELEFRIHPADALSGDDSRFETVFVADPIPVLLVEGRPRGRSFEAQTFFAAAALDPAFGTTNAGLGGFELRTVTPAEIAAALAPVAGKRPPEVVLLPGLRSVPTEARRAITGFAGAGGGVLAFVGDDVTANGFNADYAGLLPVALRAVESAPPESPWRLGEFDPAAPGFTPFRPANSGNLALPQFLRRFTVVPSEKSVVSARFEDGVPLLVGGEVGRGRVLLVNSSADTSWNDWPKHKTFVPWLRHAVQFLARKPDAGWVRSGTTLEAGREELLDLGAGSAQASLRLVGPGGRTVTAATDARGRLDPGSLSPGNWSVRTAEGRELTRFSVNAASSEADLVALRPDEFQAQLRREPAVMTADVGAALLGGSPGRQEFWRPLLLAVLALLVLETLLSNRSRT